MLHSQAALGLEESILEIVVRDEGIAEGYLHRCTPVAQQVENPLQQHEHVQAALEDDRDVHGVALHLAGGLCDGRRFSPVISGKVLGSDSTGA